MTEDNKHFNILPIHHPFVQNKRQCSKIRQMVDEYLTVQQQWLPQYTKSIEAAALRLAEARRTGTFIQNKRDFKGAARLHPKTVEEMRMAQDKASQNAANADKA